jgi:predicted ABC-type sugar transport system permease subunit
VAGEGVRVPAAVANEPAERRTIRSRFSASFTLFILLALVLVFALLQGTRFFNVGNAQNIALNASQLLLLTVGVTFVIITAGIDLSVGAVLVFSAVIAAKTMIWLSGSPEQVRSYQFPNQEIGIPVGLLAGVVAGTGWGIVNGLLITRLKMPSFIVTLGTLGMALGAARLLTGGTTVPNVPPAVQQEIGLRQLVGTEVFGTRVALTPPLVVTALVVVCAALALSRTRFGRYTFAIGSNDGGGPAGRDRRRPPPAQGLRVERPAGGDRRWLRSAPLRHRVGRLPRVGQPGRDLGGGDRWYQPVRRPWHDRRLRDRRLHPGRAAQRLGHLPRPVVLAGGADRRHPGRCRLPRPAAAGHRGAHVGSDRRPRRPISR